MPEQEQIARWRFESEHASLIVYHEGQKIAHFAGGEFETSDQAVAEVLRGFDAYCHEAPIAPTPIVIHNVEAAGEPEAGESTPAPARPKPARAHK